MLNSDVQHASSSETLPDFRNFSLYDAARFVRNDKEAVTRGCFSQHGSVALRKFYQFFAQAHESAGTANHGKDVLADAEVSRGLSSDQIDEAFEQAVGLTDSRSASCSASAGNSLYHDSGTHGCSLESGCHTDSHKRVNSSCTSDTSPYIWPSHERREQSELPDLSSPFPNTEVPAHELTEQRDVELAVQTCVATDSTTCAQSGTSDAESVGDKGNERQDETLVQSYELQCRASEVSPVGLVRGQGHHRGRDDTHVNGFQSVYCSIRNGEHGSLYGRKAYNRAELEDRQKRSSFDRQEQEARAAAFSAAKLRVFRLSQKRAREEKARFRRRETTFTSKRVDHRHSLGHVMEMTTDEDYPFEVADTIGVQRMVETLLNA